MLNHIVLQARLVRDPELRKLPSGKSVANVSVACDRDFAYKETGERETDFIDVVAFGGTADHLAKWFTKGKMIIVSGRLKIRNWVDKENNKRRSAEVEADSVYFGDSKKSSEGTYSPPAANASQGYGGDFSETEALIKQYQSQGMRSDNDFAMLDDDSTSFPF